MVNTKIQYKYIHMDLERVKKEFGLRIKAYRKQSNLIKRVDDEIIDLLRYIQPKMKEHIKEILKAVIKQSTKTAHK